MCNAHYLRAQRHGSPTSGAASRRPAGSGWIDANGYLTYQIDGRVVGEHVLIAERALGKRLPIGTEVHHVDGNPSNNVPGNLVICPSHEYHALLHMRERALNSCGNASWRLCGYCSTHDDPSRMKSSGRYHWHHACKLQYQRDRRARQSIQPTKE